MKVAMNYPTKKYKLIKNFYLDGGRPIFEKDDIIEGKYVGNRRQYNSLYGVINIPEHIEHLNHSIPLEYVIELPSEKNTNIFGELPMVTCPDGTTDIANGFAPPCMGKYVNNKPTEEQQRLLALQKVTDSEIVSKNAQNKTKEPIYYILVTAGAVILGYFAYKKFKK